MRHAEVYAPSVASSRSGVSKARLQLLAGILCFRLALDLTYYFYMHDAYGTHFLTPMPINFSAWQYLASFIFALLPKIIFAMDATADEKLFNEIRYGIPWTAMPAWKDTITDDQIWAVSYYVKSLMDMKDTQLRKDLMNAIKAENQKFGK